MNGWNTVLLFLNQVPYGQADPEFGLDLMFFMATLPFLSMVVGYLISVVLIAGLAGLAVHYLYGSVRVEEGGGIRVAPAARVHVGGVVLVEHPQVVVVDAEHRLRVRGVQFDLAGDHFFHNAP